MNCEGPCGLELPDRYVFKCDRHCDKKLCIRCIKKHADEVTMTFRTVPRLLVETNISKAPANSK